ncbi:MAG: hypothetical protein ABW211_05090, partial [Acidimicrobiia bacterium]
HVAERRRVQWLLRGQHHARVLGGKVGREVLDEVVAREPRIPERIDCRPRTAIAEVGDPGPRVGLVPSSAKPET